jgi:hypothetical protein
MLEIKSSALAVRLCAIASIFVFTTTSCGDSNSSTGDEDATQDTLDGSGVEDASEDLSDGDDDTGLDGEDSGIGDSDDGSDDGSGDGPRLENGELCMADDECASFVCIRIDPNSTQGICSNFCFEDDDCVEDNDCAFFVNSGGDAVRVCVPQDLCIDADEDGFGLGAGCLGYDCDDEDPNRNPQADEVCDDLDNDCDGIVDDNVVGLGSACETPYPGVCATGRQRCVGGTPMCEPVVAASDEICDGLDNDCDGSVDEGADGEALMESCYAGPAGTAGVGQCVAGTRVCTEGTFTTCEGQVLPFPEICDGLDNDCDGDRDEDALGGTIVCETGLPGVCATGVRTCDGTGDCVPLNEAEDERCDGLDNDCDGDTDEDEEGEDLGRECYTGPEGTLDVGVCRGGTETCSSGTWTSCADQVTPGFEICDGLDNDCDGQVDEGAAGVNAPCSTGLDGVCDNGRTACEEGELVCVGAQTASDEVCDGLDNDCDGDIDEDASGEALERSCFDDDPAFIGVGVCATGIQTCAGGEYGACIGDVTPSVELCDGRDNDCDDVVDEDAVGGGSCSTGLDGVCALGILGCGEGSAICTSLTDPSAETCDGLDNDCDGSTDEDDVGSPLARTCYTGPAGTEDVGRCVGGAETCSGGGWSSCTDQVLPTLEVCDGIDNDCDGETDEGNPGSGASCSTGGLGVCAAGTTLCDEGEVVCVALNDSGPEVCDGFDNDCDGETDENADGDPLARACYGGPAGTRDVGICVGGTETCSAGEWSTCSGQTLPAFEICDGVDNDCDGTVDDGNPGGGLTCNTGLSGICASGVTACDGGDVVCNATNSPGVEICDGIDNDCDGQIDEDTDGDPLARTCYGGPAGTRDVGICVGGTETCTAGEWSTCSGQILPGFELCDGADNDCDGAVDEGNPEGGLSCNTGLSGICAAGITACDGGDVVCNATNSAGAEVCDGIDNDCDGATDENVDGDPLTRACYTGADGTEDVGICAGGAETCTAGEWSTCSDQVTPTVEVCDGIDNDCDGTPDDGNPGSGNSCTTDQPGICRIGLTTCEAGEIACEPINDPGTEVCDGLDNDCDGVADENADGDPLDRACYTGPAGTEGVGLCTGGTETCTTGDWTSCAGQVTPTVEVCDGVDNDCDGEIDEGNPGSGASCSTGEPGICATGRTTCSDGALACEPINDPVAEVCDGLDNDCDGDTDEDGSGADLTRSCYTGPFGTEDVGLCTGGTETCTGGAWSSCAGQVTPSFELCDTLDNDCDDEVDEGNPEAGFNCDTGLLGICAQGQTACTGGAVVCEQLFDAAAETCDGFDNDCDGIEDEDEIDDPLTRHCYDGPEGTEDVGVCVGGTATCRFGDYGGCVGQVIPVTEVCDFIDNDCDDEVDEGAQTFFYEDKDGDGYGDPDAFVLACQGPGYVTNNLDCYDLNELANIDQRGFFDVDRGDGSFDYDCNGTDERRWETNGVCSSNPPFCYLQVEGWEEGTAIPACGEIGDLIFDCIGNGNNCDPTDIEVTRQECR